MLSRIVKSADLWVGLVLMMIGGVTLYGVEQMFVPKFMPDALGPRTIPTILGWLLVILALIIWVRAALRGSDQVDLGRLGTLGFLLGALFVYLFLFERLGYVISTALFMAVLFVYLGERRHWLTAIISVGATALFYAAFADFLNVNLPVGPLGF